MCELTNYVKRPVIAVAIVIHRITKAFASLRGPHRVQACLSQKRSKCCSRMLHSVGRSYVYPFAWHPRTFTRVTLRSLDNLSFSEHCPRRISSRRSVSYVGHKIPHLYLGIFTYQNFFHILTIF